jgi:hypothetical protein
MLELGKCEADTHGYVEAGRSQLEKTVLLYVKSGVRHASSKEMDMRIAQEVSNSYTDVR